MKQISNKEYEEYQKYKQDKSNGRVLTSDGLRLICEANEFNPWKIGHYILEDLAHIERK